MMQSFILFNIYYAAFLKKNLISRNFKLTDLSLVPINIYGESERNVKKYSTGGAAGCVRQHKNLFHMSETSSKEKGLAKR